MLHHTLINTKAETDAGSIFSLPASPFAVIAEEILPSKDQLALERHNTERGIEYGVFYTDICRAKSRISAWRDNLDEAQQDFTKARQARWNKPQT